MSDPLGIFLPKHWMDALCEGDVAKLLAMYDVNAVLIPTFSNEPIQGHEALEQYFNEFAGSRPNLCGEVHEEIDQNLHDGHRSISGHYTFTWDGGSAEARYTFVIQEGGDEWVIHTHHSSEFPHPE